MPFVYNAANLLLHTSEYEGFGMPLLEAMACGIHIVASNKTGIPEALGGCGELVDIDNNDCIAQFSEKVIDCLTLGRNYQAIERSNKFQWRTMVKETIRIYGELLAS